MPFDLEAFWSACPDVWLLEAEPARENLEREHQHDLRSLARSQADLPAGTALTVSVRALGPGQLDLLCLSLDGVTSMTVDLGDQLDHPEQVRRWVSDAARRAA